MKTKRILGEWVFLYFILVLVTLPFTLIGLHVYTGDDYVPTMFLFAHIAGGVIIIACKELWKWLKSPNKFGRPDYPHLRSTRNSPATTAWHEAKAAHRETLWLEEQKKQESYDAALAEWSEFWSEDYDRQLRDLKQNVIGNKEKQS